MANTGVAVVLENEGGLALTDAGVGGAHFACAVGKVGAGETFRVYVDNTICRTLTHSL